MLLIAALALTGLIGRRHIAMPSSDRGIHNAFVLPNSLRLKPGGRMFNIVRRRDFLLGTNLPTRSEAQQICDEKYGSDHIVIETDEPPRRADHDPAVRLS